jgi:hypothetical protein
MTSCESNRDYIILRSIDNEQNVKIDAEKMQIFPGTTPDTTILHYKMRRYEYRDKDFVEVLANTVDSTFFVIKIDRLPKGMEGEIFCSLFGEIHQKQATKLYLLEVGHFAHYWGLEHADISIQNYGKNKVLKLSATLKAIGFQAPCTIRFPYDERGLYDYDIERYMKVESESQLDGDMLKYFQLSNK